MTKHPLRCPPQENGERIFSITEKQLFCLMQGWTHTSLSDPKNIVYTIAEDNDFYNASHSDAKKEREKYEKILLGIEELFIDSEEDTFQCRDCNSIMRRHMTELRQAGEP
jgi:hypothetical protein